MEGLAHAPATGPQLDGRRALAALVDLLIVGAVAVLLGTLLGEATGLPALALGWALYYYFAFESSGGQTPGKRLVGLRVVRADGGRVGMREAAVRTVLRVVDGIGLYLVGLVVMLVTGKRRQRLGDLAAGTVVTSADAPAEPALAAAAPAPAASAPAPAPAPTAPAPAPTAAPDVGTPLPATQPAQPAVPEVRDFRPFETPAEAPPAEPPATEARPIEAQQDPVEESAPEAPAADAPAEVAAPEAAPVEESALPGMTPADAAPVEDAPLPGVTPADAAPVEEAPLPEVPPADSPLTEVPPPEDAPVEDASAERVLEEVPPLQDAPSEQDPRAELLRAIEDASAHAGGSDEEAVVRPSRLEIVSNPIDLVMDDQEPADGGSDAGQDTSGDAGSGGDDGAA